MSRTREESVEVSAERRLKAILDRKDRTLTVAMRTLNAELKRLVGEPDRVVIRKVGFDALRQVRRRLQLTRQTIAAVNTQSPARKQLLQAFDAFDESLAQLRISLGLPLSRESIARMQRATKRMDETGRVVRRIYKGLGR